MPFNLEQNIQENEEKHLQEIEIKSKEHLERMFEITRNLSYDDIRLLKNDTNNKSTKNEKENQYEDRERQD